MVSKPVNKRMWCTRCRTEQRLAPTCSDCGAPRDTQTVEFKCKSCERPAEQVERSQMRFYTCSCGARWDGKKPPPTTPAATPRVPPRKPKPGPALVQLVCLRCDVTVRAMETEKYCPRDRCNGTLVRPSTLPPRWRRERDLPGGGGPGTGKGG